MVLIFAWHDNVCGTQVQGLIAAGHRLYLDRRYAEARVCYAQSVTATRTHTRLRVVPTTKRPKNALDLFF